MEKLLGAEFRIKYMAEGERMMVIPPWAVVGWVREHDYQDTPNKSMTTKKSVARAMAVDEKAKTAVWKDFPLFLAEEEKSDSVASTRWRAQTIRFRDAVPCHPWFCREPRPVFPLGGGDPQQHSPCANIAFSTDHGRACEETGDALE